MKLKDLAEKVGKLPEFIDVSALLFDIGRERVENFDQINRIMFEQAVYIRCIADAYNKLRDIILELEVE